MDDNRESAKKKLHRTRLSVSSAVLATAIIVLSAAPALADQSRYQGGDLICQTSAGYTKIATASSASGGVSHRIDMYGTTTQMSKVYLGSSSFVTAWSYNFNSTSSGGFWAEATTTVQAGSLSHYCA